MEKRGYRAKDAAKYLGISLSGFWLFVKQGKFSPIKLSESITIFTIEDLNRFIDEKIQEQKGLI